mmetsp:Transcript_12790/g.30175  ORF Transcript_12790/g.30175 Transcript_12790/m.30175 type:complete len:225 (-) Transcript_12790:1958-2632(-)
MMFLVSERDTQMSFMKELPHWASSLRTLSSESAICVSANSACENAATSVRYVTRNLKTSSVSIVHVVITSTPKNLKGMTMTRRPLHRSIDWIASAWSSSLAYGGLCMIPATVAMEPATVTPIESRNWMFLYTNCMICLVWYGPPLSCGSRSRRLNLRDCQPLRTNVGIATRKEKICRTLAVNLGLPPRPPQSQLFCIHVTRSHSSMLAASALPFCRSESSCFLT